jgi:hypothetical protein
VTHASALRVIRVARRQTGWRRAAIAGIKLFAVASCGKIIAMHIDLLGTMAHLFLSDLREKMWGLSRSPSCGSSTTRSGNASRRGRKPSGSRWRTTRTGTPSTGRTASSSVVRAVGASRLLDDSLRTATERVGAFAARPWRFGAADYIAAVRFAPRHGRQLRGPDVLASWDEELTSAMTRHGVAIAEEAVAAVLLQDLAVRPTTAADLSCTGAGEEDDGAIRLTKDCVTSESGTLLRCQFVTAASGVEGTR